MQYIRVLYYENKQNSSKNTLRECTRIEDFWEYFCVNATIDFRYRWIFKTMAVNSIMVRLLVIEITFLILAVVNSYPAFGENEYKHKNRDKGRTIRGFKNMDLSTARGFGKRAEHYAMNLIPSDLLVPDNKDDSFNQK